MPACLLAYNNTSRYYPETLCNLSSRKLANLEKSWLAKKKQIYGLSYSNGSLEDYREKVLWMRAIWNFFPNARAAPLWRAWVRVRGSWQAQHEVQHEKWFETSLFLLIQRHFQGLALWTKLRCRKTKWLLLLWKSSSACTGRSEPACVVYRSNAVLSNLVRAGCNLPPNCN